LKRKKKNIVLEKIRVEDYAAEGRSLARVEGKVIFIDNAVPGDLVDVRILKSKKDWAEGIALKIHEFSPDRVVPFCSHFGVCGGCQWQMLPYEKQLEYKQKQVKDNLERIGRIELPEIQQIIGADPSRYYRNKIEYTFGNKRYLQQNELSDPDIRSEQDVAGFHAKGLFDKVVDIETCHLQEEPTNAIRLAVKEFGKKNRYSFYDIRNHSGFLRTMQIRACTTGEIMVNIVTGEDDKEKTIALLEFVTASFPSLTTVLYTINKKWNDSLHDLDPIIYKGKGFVIEKLSVDKESEPFQFKIGPKSFFQTNTRQAEQLYRVALGFADLTGEEILYDLYCGTGSIGIFASKGAKKIIGVEMIGEAVKDAKENAAMNGLKKAEFFTGDVAEICNEEFFILHGKPDVIISDPPRAGMHDKLVKKILDIEAPTIVYVSCNPATQARDLNLLDEKYKVTAIRPVDMFPHTHHIENVVQLKRRDR
jgi:23S rRNA (uracil1939-C5)-methyltransferase